MIAIDIALSFRVTILDIITGEEIVDPKLIKKRRLRSISLYVDIITVIPLDVIRAKEILALISLIKIYKLGRLAAFIQNLNVKSNLKLVRIKFTPYLTIIIDSQTNQYLHVLDNLHAQLVLSHLLHNESKLILDPSFWVSRAKAKILLDRWPCLQVFHYPLLCSAYVPNQWDSTLNSLRENLCDLCGYHLNNDQHYYLQ